MLGSPPWSGFPVGALVVCTTRTKDNTSLQFTLPSITGELNLALQECEQLLDTTEPLKPEIGREQAYPEAVNTEQELQTREAEDKAK